MLFLFTYLYTLASSILNVSLSLRRLASSRTVHTHKMIATESSFRHDRCLSFSGTTHFADTRDLAAAFLCHRLAAAGLTTRDSGLDYSYLYMSNSG
jgi:hypothetical protein